MCCCRSTSVSSTSWHTASENRTYPEGHPWRPYFIRGLTVKIGGAVFIGLIYQYYYGGGDTANYFHHANVINSAFAESPVKWLNLILHTASWYDGAYGAYTSQMEWYGSLNNYAVAALAAFFGALTFNTFLPTSILFAALSYTGIWAMFRTFAQQYPRLVPRVALAMLFVPSTFIWGSGIFKDTICMFALGWMLYAIFQLLVQRRLRIPALAMGVLGFYLMAIIKIYILMAFLPALAMWILFNYSSKVRSGFVRAMLTLGIIGMTAASIFLFSGAITSNLGQYSAENIVKTSITTRGLYLCLFRRPGFCLFAGRLRPVGGRDAQKIPAGGKREPVPALSLGVAQAHCAAQCDRGDAVPVADD